MKVNRVVPIVVIGVLVAGTAYAGWRVTVQQAAQESGPLALSGTIEASEVLVSSRVAGRIVSSLATEGARVSSGDILFQLDDEPARLTYAQARAGVRAARAAWKQARDDDKSAATIAAAKARYQQAVLAQRMAKLQVGYARVSAPASGGILSVSADMGENAAPGQTLAVIGELDDLYVSVFVPEERIGEVRAGQPAVVRVDSSAETFRGHVTYIASAAEFTPATVETKDQRTKLVYEVRVSVADGSGTLKPGMPADVAFE